MLIYESFDEHYLVDSATGCHLWLRYVSPAGYGRLMLRGKGYAAHRWAYERAHGPIPPGLLVCHTCDVRRCVNPAHLFLGTHKDNMQDASRKNRIDRSGRPGVKNGRAVLTEEQVRTVRIQLLRGETQRAVAKAFGVGKSTIAWIASGYTWRHI